MGLMTTEDLPPEFRLDQAADLSEAARRAVTGSGLQVTCEHGEGCANCVADAARILARVLDADQPA